MNRRRDLAGLVGDFGNGFALAAANGFAFTAWVRVGSVKMNGYILDLSDSGKANTKILFPEVGRSSGVKSRNRGEPVLATTY